MVKAANLYARIEPELKNEAETTTISFRQIWNILLVTTIVFLCGCGTTGKFVYPARMTTLFRVGSDMTPEKTVAVLPFDDYRSDDNSSWYLMYLIPLMPFGWVDYERPDAASMFPSILTYDMTPAEDLGKATSVSLRQSRMFKDAFFTMGGEKDKADFVWHGQIKEMRYRGKMITYGLSVYGPLLWVVGFPASTSENVLSIEFQLKDKNGKIVWEYSAERSDWIVQWLYYRMGHDCKAFAAMYQNVMNDALSNLANDMHKNPEKFGVK